MKQQFIVIVIFISTFFFYACDNDLNVTESWKDITVVYGLLNSAEAVNYIRVEKGFLDENTSALVVAQRADSLYYANLNVELVELHSMGATTHSLTRVDANTMGLQRDTGIFATTPNYVYKFDEPINTDANYRLVITKADGQEVTAQTGIIDEFNLTLPLDSTLGWREYDDEVFFRWRSDEDAAFYELVFRFHYLEAPVNDPTNFVSKSFDWMVDSKIQPVNNSGIVSLQVLAQNFFQTVGANLSEGEVIRQFDRIDVLIWAGGADLLSYIEVGSVNAGITGAEVLPTYTNLSEGFGIFSTRRSQLFPNFKLRSAALDSLSLGIYTRHLNFED